MAWFESHLNGGSTPIPKLNIYEGKVDLSSGTVVSDSDYYYTDFFPNPNGTLIFSMGESSSSYYIGLEMCDDSGSNMNYWSASSNPRIVDCSYYYSIGCRKLRASFKKSHINDVYWIDITTNTMYSVEINPVEIQITPT